MKSIEAKNILTTVKYNDWFGIDFNMNLYHGCSHGCIYCDSRSNCYNIQNFDQIKIKKNALFILENDLKRKRNKGVVGMGSMSDPYNPLEIDTKLTRESLKLLDKYGFGVSIDTKSDLILRDLDILSKLNKEHNVIIKISITSANDALSSIIEPNVCNSSKRFETIKALSNQGIFCGILLTPVLPFISDSIDNIKEIVKRAHENGAKFIYTEMGMTLRDSQRDYYFNKLDEYFIGLKNQYILYYRGKYNCKVPSHKELYKVFIEECNKYGILYKMNEIIDAYKRINKDFEQVSLF